MFCFNETHCFATIHNKTKTKAIKNIFYTIRKLLIKYNASPLCGLQLFSLERYDPCRFPSCAGLAYVLKCLQLQGEQGNTYTANGTEKKRNPSYSQYGSHCTLRMSPCGLTNSYRRFREVRSYGTISL
jgi:hypothetical protein